MKDIIRIDTKLDSLVVNEMPYCDYLFGEDYIKYGGYNKQTFSLSKTLNFFANRYVAPLAKLVNIKDTSICDGACGYGWFTFAYILFAKDVHKNCKVTCVDIDPKRKEIVESFAKLLGVEKQIEFIDSSLSDLPFDNKQFDIFVSIETLEHIPRSHRNTALKEISRVSNYQLITTPNKLWPIDYHDSKTPFLHWFDGRFLTQWQIGKNLNSELLSNVYCFDNFEELESIYPLYWPYPGQTRQIRKLSILPFKLLSNINKKLPQYLMPQLQGIYKSNDKS